MMNDLFTTFARNLEAAGGVAFRCSPDECVALVLQAAASFAGEPAIRTAAVTSLLPSLPAALERAGVICRPADSLETALTCPLALSTAVFAIAETGTVVTAERELAQRAPTMLSTAAIVFTGEENLVATLDDAGAWLRRNVGEAPYVSFVTGPSRTADIERTLTIGVQGPASLTVVLVEGVPAGGA